MLNPFGDGFSLAELSQAITLLPNMYGRLTKEGLFNWVPQTDPNVIIEMRNGVLALVPTSPWGGVAPKNDMGKRNLRTFRVPHTQLEDVVMASDVMGIRAFGTADIRETVQGKVNDKLQVMKNKMDQTMEWRKMGALKGVVYDSDASTIIYDYFDEFGITKKVVDFELDDNATNVLKKCLDLARYLEDNLFGEVMNGATSLVSPEFYDSFTKHPNVEKAYAQHAEAAQRFGTDMRKGFAFGGLVLEEYRAVVDGHRFIDAGKGVTYPRGTMETFANYGAPADFGETVNTMAMPYYARMKSKDFNRGMDLHTQANQLPLVSRPGLIVEMVQY